MASLTRRKSGKAPGYEIQWYEGKSRRTIYLSGRKYSRKRIEDVKEMVEVLIRYKDNGTLIPDKTVYNKLEAFPKELLLKLAKGGLINLIEQKTNQQLWDAVLNDRKKDGKPATMVSYRSCQKHFFEVFLPTDFIETITPNRLLEWKSALRVKYKEASVATHLKVVRTVLNWAVKQEWLPKSPMTGISIGRFINRDNDRIITKEECAKLLDACPNQEWRVIIALLRIGALRPSEIKLLRWRDILWEQNRFLVHSPKTERYARHSKRYVPLFQKLRQELELLRQSNAAADDAFVIQCLPKRSSMRYHTLETICNDAGLGKIARHCDNMRMSRSNEIREKYGEAKESRWIGHSKKVMMDHYFCLTDKDFSEAAKDSDD